VRAHDRGQPGLDQQRHRAPGGAAAKEAIDLLEHARLGALGDLPAVAQERRQRLRLDLEVEPRGELHRAQHAHRVLAEPDVRVADRAHGAAFEVIEPADVVDDPLGLDVVEQAIDGEVAAPGVLDLGPEDVVAPDEQLVGLGGLLPVARVGAEGGGLDDLRAEEDVRQAKAPADDPAVAKQLLDFLRSRAGRDIEVLRRPLQ
jgi:hypothetical protein